MIRLLLCLVIALSLVAASVADDSHFAEHAGANGKYVRRFTENLSPHTLVLAAARDTSDQQTRLLLTFTTVGFPRLRFSRYHADQANDNATDFTFRIGFRRIVEFNDTNSNCFDNNDTVVSQFSFLGHTGDWSAISRSTSQATDGSNATIFQYCTSLNRHNAAGTFTLCLKISGQKVIDNKGHAVSPTRVKLDISWSNYSFTGAGTKLALIALISSKSVAIGDDPSTPRTIFFAQNGAVDWVSTLDVPLGWPVTASAIRDLSDVNLDENRSGDGGGNDGNDDDSFAGTEITKAVSFCIDNTTHSTSYVWDPSVEINDPNSAATLGAVLPFILAALLSLLIAF